jgi:hypothetical protein
MRILIIALALLVSAPPQPQIFDTLQKLRAEYPTPMQPAQLAELLNRAAYEHRSEGWKLLKKGAGNSCPLKPGNVFISCDILIGGPGTPPHHFDVLQASDAEAIPQWHDVGPCELGPTSGCSMSNAIDPIRPTNAPAPTPGPVTPPPAPVDLSAILARLSALEGEVAGLKAQGVDLRNLIAASDKDLRAIIDALPKAGMVPCESLPPYSGKNWAGRLTSTAVCK